MRIIGLTGPSGGGKSTVADVLEQQGVVTIDCDLIAREVVERQSPLLQVLSEAFGDDIILPDGSLDRKLLAKKAFSNAESTELLNSIMLPFISSRITEMIELYKNDGVECVLLDAPTLYQSGLDSICDSVVAVLCPKEIRKKRIIERDGLTDEQAETRLNASPSDDFYKSKTTHIVVNDGELQSFLNRISEIFGAII